MKIDDDALAQAAHLLEPDGIDREAIERSIEQILRAVGEDPQRNGLLKTPSAWRACMKSCWMAIGSTRMSW